MAFKVLMPRLSDTMEEGKIIRWEKKEGNKVKKGDILAEVETDKANLEMEAYSSGILREIIVKEGESAPVGDLIAIIGEEKEDISGILKEGEAEPVEEEKDNQKGRNERKRGGKAKGKKRRKRRKGKDFYLSFS